MKRIFLMGAVAAMLFTSCGESVESKAGKLLQQAGEAYAAGDYRSSKLLIDSIRGTYPTAFEARRGALNLMRDVELAEQQRNLDHCKAVLDTLAARRDSMLADFEYEKDNRYQDEGSYVCSSQAGRLNVFNSLLRARTTESGRAYVTSVYRGKRISHRAVKVSAGDSYASCDKPFSSHIYRNLGVNNERLDFIYGEDDGIMDFVAAATQPITVELTGADGSYSYTLRREDAVAVTKVMELSRVLRAITEHREMAAEAQRHIDFVKKTRERFAADSVSVGK